ncbi:FAR1-related sequence 9-like protein [Tanacetum coccineum]
MVPNSTKYTVNIFDVEHIYELDMVEYKHFSKAERKLTYAEQLFIIKDANANIGAVKAYNLYTGLKGSSSLVHGTQTEFKNFTRGVNCFIGDINAQMLITRMEERQQYTKDISFDYFVEDAELCGLFWANEVLKCNYKEFGDIVSFDATYKTNKKAFVRAPNIVVTDQDGAMRLVVAAEFPESKHRLCVWHIMQKIPSKLLFIIYDETDFKAKFSKIVWNMFIGLEEFEDRWNKLIEEFNLVNHKWVSKMYRIRSSWIPAFFVDSPLCGLMRTTSRSESESSFFSYFNIFGSTLVKFMLYYEFAMERQRYMQERLDHQLFDSFPNLLTPLPFKFHAAKVYTRILFTRVQKEIVAGSWLCSIKAISSDEGCDVCVIDEEKPKPKPVTTLEVIDKESTSKNVEEEEINLHQKEQKNRYGKKNEAIERLAIEASIIVDSCVHMLSTNEPKLTSFVNKIKSLKAEVEADLLIVPTRIVSELVQEFMGVKKPNKVNVKNPSGVKTKGHEKEKRIKGGREISMEKHNKKRMVMELSRVAVTMEMVVLKVFQFKVYLL